jgi:hypothetical protein
MHIGRAFVALATATSPTVAAAPPERTQAEINHLFNYLKSSGCKVSRNGKWYAAEPATQHLQMKYDYLIKKNLLTSTESFIELGATSSSTSGKPYLVQCAASEPVASAHWFKAELAKFRAANPNKN